MRKLIPLFIFGLALGIIGASLEIYLRPLVNGTEDFTLRVLQPELLNKMQLILVRNEAWRLLAGFILLATAAALAASSIFYWVCYVVFTWSVSTVVSYCWLALRFGWPASLFDWDILFTVPRLWFAPVLAVVLIALIAVALSVILTRALDISEKLGFEFYHWIPLGMAVFLWVVSFLNRSGKGMKGFPASYSWTLFILGAIFALVGGVVIYRDLIIKRKRWLFK